MQLEIIERTPLTDRHGRFTARGYARSMVFDYAPGRLKSSPFALKEWDFYQISDSRYVLQMTIGHVSYVGSVSANLFDLQTGEKRTVGRMQPFVFGRLGMETDPERQHALAYSRKGIDMRFETGANHRTLTLSSEGADGTASVDITLTNCAPDKDKMVIATPFDKPKQFYLNYKENCFTAAGTATIGDMTVKFGDKAFGLLDWGRGVWPFRHEWIWGNGSTTVGSRPFGFNIGWGFGDTTAATENMFFYDNKAVKLGRVFAESRGEGRMATTRYRDEDGCFELTCEPIYDNFTTTNVLIVNNSCHQVFGSFSGYVVLHSGERLEIPPFVAFVEHARNQW